MSLEKWRIEEGWILFKIDGLQCSINCLHFNRGTTLSISEILYEFRQHLDSEECRVHFSRRKSRPPVGYRGYI
jgi:hypothetical protein